MKTYCTGTESLTYIHEQLECKTRFINILTDIHGKNTKLLQL